MVGDRIRNVDAAESGQGAADAEIDIFQVRFEGSVEQSNPAEQLGPEQGGGAGSHFNRAGTREIRSIEAAIPGTPGAGGAADQIPGSVDAAAVGRAEGLAGREPDALGLNGSRQPREPFWLRLDVAVDQRHEFGSALFDAPVDGAGEASIFAQTNDAGAAQLGGFSGSVARSVIDRQHFGGRQGLQAQFFEQADQQIAAIPDRDDDCDSGLHEKRFLTRNQRFWNPSLQGFSLISPRREV